MMLVLSEVHTKYGKIEALHGISFEIDEGEIITLIGTNGAGKSTTLKTIVGWQKSSRGSIQFNHENITHLPTHRIVARGLALVPEGREVFGDMTVFENLEMGAFLRKDKQAIRGDLDRVFGLFPILKDRRRQLSKSLSGGEQQMLAISRGLMTEPKLMLLDEPSLGLAPMLVRSIFETLVEINRQGVTLFLVEQNANMALKVAQRGYVLEKGRITTCESSEALIADKAIQKTYLGMD